MWLRNLCSFFFAAALTAAAFALPEAEWRYRQGFPIERSGVLRVAIPLETLDHAESDLRDVRVVAPDGREVPFALVRPAPSPARSRPAPQFEVALQPGATVVTIETSGEKTWEAIEFITPSSSFLKAAHLEASLDGKTWSTWQEGAPLFRRDGVQQTTISLPKKPALKFRVTLDDRRQAPIIITGINLREPPTQEVPLEPVAARIARSDDYATETALTLALPAANLDLDSLEVITSDGLFTRQVRVGLPQFDDGEIQERTLATDTIFRLRLDDTPPAEKIRAALPAALPAREVILHVENGDSPPLRIEQITAMRRIVYLAFEARVPGRYTLWSGNPEASAPRYDLALIGDQLRQLAPTPTVFESPSENATYRRKDPLAGLSFEGPPVKLSDWSARRAVQLTGVGVHLLELDLSALTTAQRSLADLRLVRGEKQVPYILERTKLSRALELAVTSQPDPKLPSLSRWHFALPRPGAPISQIALTSSAALFQREIRIYERRERGNGENYEADLGRATWRRTPQDPQTALIVSITMPQTRELWIETDNGDNSPLPLDQVKAFHPVIRLLFRTDTNEGLSLLTGNLQVAPPRYDLGLVAHTLLASEKHPASLTAAEEPLSETSAKLPAKSVLFWVALALVVIALLVVVAKLLPKPPS